VEAKQNIFENILVEFFKSLGFGTISQKGMEKGKFIFYENGWGQEYKDLGEKGRFTRNGKG
jgi:hypothetical protein